MSDPRVGDDRLAELISWTGPGGMASTPDVYRALLELRDRRAEQTPTSGSSGDPPALDVDREVARIMTLDEGEVMVEICRLAASWLDDEDGADRISSAYRARAEQLQVGEYQYLALLRRVLDSGQERGGARSVFGAQLRLDLRLGFPAMTTRRVDFSSVVRELLWTLSGSTSVRGLQLADWDHLADDHGELWSTCGHQWRRWAAATPRKLRVGGLDLDSLVSDLVMVRDRVTSWSRDGRDLEIVQQVLEIGRAHV